MKDFAGRTAFVTGGANGVGIGLVRALLAQGCSVAIADIRPASIDAALRALDNPRAMGVEVDVSSRKDLARAAEAVEARFGVVSLLFNNAGVNLFQSIEESSYDDWDWIMGVNLDGPINGVMTFVPRMIRAGHGGYVVNTASMAGFLAAGVCGIYNTTSSPCADCPNHCVRASRRTASVCRCCAPGWSSPTSTRAMRCGRRDSRRARSP